MDMKLLVITWFLIFMIFFEHGIYVQGRACLSIPRISQHIQSSYYVTLTGNATSHSDATMIVTLHVVTATSRSSHRFVCYVVEKILNALFGLEKKK
ncbi:hypothetical protein Lal_00039463 [Lupinus albus]|nr:hypothetical protein Lal_00039463 [Lupinus albus]